MPSTMGVHFQLPSAALFRLPPAPEPHALPPPAATSFAHTAPPFTIPAGLYERALAVPVPVTLCALYIVTATALSRANIAEAKRAAGAGTPPRPWRIARSQAFHVLVLVHNVLLALYSAWTFWGMHAAVVRRSFVAPWSAATAASTPATGHNHYHGGGGVPRAGWAASIDSLCKMHGPGGLGDAVVYNVTRAAWIAPHPAVRLDALQTPDVSDVGRIWNEGLAFYGWLFYVSKFYEVIDTFIVLAKGKKVSTLQLYHHAGAMFCMWVGIRYMSPPIWMFVYLNSAIHTMMYMYYSLATLSVPVPISFKRTLTSMQIGQFVFGALYAAAHSFLSYDVLMQVPIGHGSPSGTAYHAGASTGIGSMVKKFLFRAAGEEGVAENVDHPHYARDMAAATMQAGHQWQVMRVPCLDTSGETFAIWFNVLYLTPLTWLFLRFFVKSYLGRSAAVEQHGQAGKQARKGDGARVVGKAGNDALKGMDREINEDNTESSGKKQ